MTIEVLEEENALVHRKNLQFRKMIVEFTERQMVLEVRVQTLDSIQKDLEKVQAEHARCKAAPDMDKFRQIFISRTMKRLGNPGQLEALQKKIALLQDLIVQLAIAAKDVTEVSLPRPGESSSRNDFFHVRYTTLVYSATQMLFIMFPGNQRG